MEVPTYVVLKSKFTGQYSNYIQDDGHLNGQVCMTGNSVLSPSAKLEFERSQTYKGYYHIRCCHNNKYWVRSGSNIVAKAKEPNEDKRSEDKCTLFEVDLFSDINFIHASGEYVYVNTEKGSKYGWVCTTWELHVEDDDAPHIPIWEAFELIDWESLVFLPRLVGFKLGGCYLQVKLINGCPYLQFSAAGTGYPPSQHEIIPNPDGSVRIKSKSTGKFWRCGTNEWVWADQQNEDSAATFYPTKVGPTTILLKMQGKQHFCSRLTTDGPAINLLNANKQNSIFEATMEVEELVLSRRIDHVDFRLDDARVCEHKEEVVSSESVLVNENEDKVQETLIINFSGTKTRTFKDGFSFSVGGEVAITAGIPIIADGKVTLKTGFETSFEWGKGHTEAVQATARAQVTVPGKSKVRGIMVGTRAIAHVPFSYTRKDCLLDGTQVSVRMDDGIFTTENFYGFHIKVGKSEKLNP